MARAPSCRGSGHREQVPPGFRAVSNSHAAPDGFNESTWSWCVPQRGHPACQIPLGRCPDGRAAESFMVVYHVASRPGRPQPALGNARDHRGICIWPDTLPECCPTKAKRTGWLSETQKRLHSGPRRYRAWRSNRVLGACWNQSRAFATDCAIINSVRSKAQRPTSSLDGSSVGTTSPLDIL